MSDTVIIIAGMAAIIIVSVVMGRVVVLYFQPKVITEEMKKESAKKRHERAVLNVAGRMSPQELQEFRQRGGCLPGEPGWLEPESPEWYAQFHR